MKIELVTLVLTAACVASAASPARAADDPERAAIQAVVESAYVQGVHAQRDAALMRAGFDPLFRMQVLKEGKVETVSLDEWITRLEKGAKDTPAPKEVKSTFALVDVQGTAAIARVELWRDGRHTFTDYLSRYKRPDGWKIVAKTFYTHPR